MSILPLYFVSEYFQKKHKMFSKMWISYFSEGKKKKNGYNFKTNAPKKRRKKSVQITIQNYLSYL